jgi:beta-lactamase superfamily II metal-dependent hydrolase
MAHKITFYPLGNADTSLIELDNNKKILFDYANMKCADDVTDKRIDLPTELNKVVKGDYDVVYFTHADKDHINGFSKYFYLEHAEKYQGANRKKIIELWVPAHLLTDKDVKDEARILRQEARQRLKNKKGIKVFSRPDNLKNWCDEQEDICFDDIKDFIVDAGTCVPGFDNKTMHGVEFFVHSPFASVSQNINRNSQAIVMHATFNNFTETKIMLGSDIDYNVWNDIIKITIHYKNEKKLLWDVFHISHHCSYTALSAEKTIDETKPDVQITWLYEVQGSRRSLIVSPSKTLPIKGSKEDDDVLPPHRQAANYYKKVASLLDGEFKVTMEHPSESEPKPMVVEIGNSGIILQKAFSTTGFVTNKPAPKAG